MEDAVGVMWEEGSWAGAGWCRATEGLGGLDLVLPRGLAELLPCSGTGFPRACLPHPGRAPPPTPALPLLPQDPRGSLHSSLLEPTAALLRPRS